MAGVLGIPSITSRSSRVAAPTPPGASRSGSDQLTTQFASSIPTGGPRNPVSGMGMPGIDKATDSYFVPTIINRREEIEVLFVQSWAARKAMYIPPVVAVAKWRTHLQTDSYSVEQIETFQKAERKWGLRRMLRRTLTAARTYGTALAVMVTDEAPLQSELNIDQIRPGSLKGFRIFDRYCARVVAVVTDFMDENWGKPLMYEFYPGEPRSFMVHASRVIRFDGIEPETDDGWRAYQQEWGLSALIPIVITVMQDQLVASAGAQLAAQASIPVHKMKRYREWISGEEFSEAGDSPIQQMMKTSMLRSLYKLHIVDHGDDVEFPSYSFGGFPLLMDRYAGRVAAAADIPETYFYGKSPAGMDATGEGDQENFTILIDSIHSDLLSPALDDMVDQVIARDAGLPEPPEYEWRSLVDLSDQEQADILDKITTAGERLINGFAISNEDFRMMVAGRPLVGQLEGPAPDDLRNEEIEAGIANSGANSGGSGDGGSGSGGS